EEGHEDEHLLPHRRQVLALQNGHDLLHALASSASAPTFSMKISSKDGAATSNRRMRSRPMQASRTSCGSAPSARGISASLVSTRDRTSCGSDSRNEPSPS